MVFRRVLWLVLLLINIVAGSFCCYADVQVVEGVGSYMAGDGPEETIASAKNRAKDEALKNAVKKAGVYVENYSRSEDLQLTEDEWIYIIGTVLEIEDERYPTAEVIDDSHIKYHAYVKIRIDTDALIETVRERDRNEIAQNAKKYKLLLEEGEKLAAENNELRKKYTAQAWGDKHKKHEIRMELKTNEEATEAQHLLLDAMRRMDCGDVEQALQFLQQSLEKQETEIAHYLKGDVFSSQGKRDLAVQEYSKAIELNPYFGVAYNNRGAVYLRDKDVQRALADFDKSIALGTNDAPPYYNRGRVMFIQKNLPEAIRCFSKALSLAPYDKFSYSYRGMAYLLQDRYSEAIEDLTKAIDLKLVDDNIYTARAEAYYTLGNMRAALNDYRAALEINPRNELARSSVEYLSLKAKTGV